MNDFIGNILQSKFYACCYILLSGRGAARIFLRGGLKLWKQKP